MDAYICSIDTLDFHYRNRFDLFTMLICFINNRKLYKNMRILIDILYEYNFKYAFYEFRMEKLLFLYFFLQIILYIYLYLYFSENYL